MGTDTLGPMCHEAKKKAKSYFKCGEICKGHAARRACGLFLTAVPKKSPGRPNRRVTPAPPQNTRRAPRQDQAPPWCTTTSTCQQLKIAADAVASMLGLMVSPLLGLACRPGMFLVVLCVQCAAGAVL